MMNYLFTRNMLSLCLFFFFALLLLLPLSPIPATVAVAASNVKTLSMPDQEPPVHYQIESNFVPSLSTIDGKVTITWTYPGTEPLSEIAIHLYQNAFAPGSTFMNNSLGLHRGHQQNHTQTGQVEVFSISYHQAEGSKDITDNLRYIQPDDDNRQDKTLALLELPEPLMPKQVLEVTISFRTHLPAIFARSGTVEPFVMAGQWYPKLAAYELAGQRGRPTEGFNLHQYHSNSEFFADFANYDVRISVPEDYIVGATGEEITEPIKEKGVIHYHFAQKWVHDFAWAADPRFVIYQDTFKPAQGEPVIVSLYTRPEKSHLATRQLNAVVGTLRELHNLFGPYPYKTLTVIDPPGDALGAGGMEYPTLITGGTPLLSHGQSMEPERVLVHETIHQYWYGIVANNEFEEAWLDEGLTTYTEGKILERLYGDSRSSFSIFGQPLLPLPLSTNSPGLFRTVLQPLVLDPIDLPAYDYASSRSYATSVYYRGALLLYSLEGLLGEEKVFDILSTYYQRWAFRHPGTDDFVAVVKEKGCSESAKFLQKGLQSPAYLDYALGDIKPLGTAEGLAWIVRIDRRGELIAPVEILILHQNGQKEIVQWSGEERYLEIRIQHSQPPLAIHIDPEERLPLDMNRLNNDWTQESAWWPAFRWTLLVALYYQSLLALAL
ncbi:M1 family metallopeptidase [Heliorestis acidaminivorans]|nr:M1 family metallopeptidase [Heliorestis acidaminivorans]